MFAIDDGSVIVAVVANTVALALLILGVVAILKRKQRNGSVTLSIQWRDKNNDENNSTHGDDVGDDRERP